MFMRAASINGHFEFSFSFFNLFSLAGFAPVFLFHDLASGFAFCAFLRSLGVHSRAKLHKFFNNFLAFAFWAFLNILPSFSIACFAKPSSIYYEGNTFQFLLSSCSRDRLLQEWHPMELILVFLFLDRCFLFSWTYQRYRIQILQVVLRLALLPRHTRHRVAFFLDLKALRMHDWFSWIYRDHRLYQDAISELSFWMPFEFARWWQFSQHRVAHNIRWYWLIFWLVLRQSHLRSTYRQIREFLRILQSLLKTFEI